MQVMDEAYSNFVNSINSDQTRRLYEYSLSKFLKYCDKDLDSFLRLPQQQTSNLIVNYLISKKISRQYKLVIFSAIKLACEMNDVILNWKKLHRFIKSEKTDNSINGKDRGYTHQEIQTILEFSDQRLKTAFLVLASTGMRIGALQLIRTGDLEKIDDLYKVTIYNARDAGLVTQQFIDEKKIELGPLFATTYEGSFDVGVGNVFDSISIDKAIKLGKQYSVDNIPIHPENPKVYGCDFGFSSSASSIIGLEHMRNQFKDGVIKEDIIRVIDLHYIQRGNPQEISDICWNIWKQHDYMNTWFYCDSSSAAMINLLKGRWNENVNWIKTKDVSPHSNKIIPVSFNGDNHKQMLSRMHLIVSKGKLAINSKYDKLISSMRTAVAEGLSLQKEKTSFDDVLDSCRVGLIPFNLN